jgi:hypothetical protein
MRPQESNIQSFADLQPLEAIGRRPAVCLRGGVAQDRSPGRLPLRFRCRRDRARRHWEHRVNYGLRGVELFSVLDVALHVLVNQDGLDHIAV